MAEPFQPRLADVVRRLVEDERADVHTAIPATVIRVDLTKGQVDATPLVKEVYVQGGERKSITVPTVTNVPIVWPGANGMRITFPLAVGDFVLLVFTERSLDAWLDTGEEVDPVDPRRHNLSDGIAIPGLRPFGKAWQDADAAKITLGSDAGARHTAAWADVTKQHFDALHAHLASLKVTFDTHTHADPQGGFVVATVKPFDPPPTVPDIESKTVLIKG